jgi:hypothetical protein
VMITDTWRTDWLRLVKFRPSFAALESWFAIACNRDEIPVRWYEMMPYLGQALNFALQRVNALPIVHRIENCALVGCQLPSGQQSLGQKVTYK